MNMYGKQGFLMVALVGCVLLFGQDTAIQIRDVGADTLKIEPLTPPSPEEVIQVWVRGAGSHSTQQVTPHRKETFQWKQLGLRSKQLFDYQYQKKRTYLGVTIHQILRQYRVPPSTDLALLHFSNGMIVPHPLTSQPLQDKKLQVFVAIAYKKGNRWVRNFPEIRREPALPIYRDIRPIQFKGNKVVVTDEGHPDVLDHIAPNVQIWRQVDTLTGIELVHSYSYYQQFATSSTNPSVQKGRLLYQGTCQFCHGVHGIGAKYGIDFVKPLALYLYAWNSKELAYHVTYKPVDATSRGIMMPAIKNMPKIQVEYLWQWLKEVATHPATAYQLPTTRPARR